MMLHGQTPESMSVDQDFPICLEAQLLGGNGKDTRTTNNLCTPGTNVVMDGNCIQFIAPIQLPKPIMAING
jgi:hypothetical protein